MGPSARGAFGRPPRRRPTGSEPGKPRFLINQGEKKGEATGPSPVDRGKAGTKHHVLCDRKGVPLCCNITGANVNDTTTLESMLDAVPPIRGKVGRPKRRPGKLHADKAYDSKKNRAVCRKRGIKSRIARRMKESSVTLGKHRWVVERTFAWLHSYRRLSTRHERRADIHLGFLKLACILVTFGAITRQAFC